MECRALLKDLDAFTSSATPLYCYNWIVIQIAHNDVFHEYIKHIEIDCHFIYHHLVHGALEMLLVSSQDQLANIFTKSHPKGHLCVLVDKLKMVSPTHLEFGGAIMCNRLVGFRLVLHTYLYLPPILLHSCSPVYFLLLEK